MPPCKTCGTKFHACWSCSLTHHWEWEYCSETCWESSDEYKNIYKTCEDIDKQLSPDIKQKLLSVINNEDHIAILAGLLTKGQ